MLKNRKVSHGAVLVLCSLFPLIPGYLILVFLSFIPTLVLLFLEISTFILWAVLSWRLYRWGDSVWRHSAQMLAVPLVLLLLLLLDGLKSGIWSYVSKIYYTPLLVLGYQFVAWIYPELWLGECVTFLLLAALTVCGALLKRRRLKKYA